MKSRRSGSIDALRIDDQTSGRSHFSGVKEVVGIQTDAISGLKGSLTSRRLIQAKTS